MTQTINSKISLPEWQLNNDSVLVETLQSGLTRNWQVKETIYNANTPFQNMKIVTTNQGIGLFCNGERQSTELTQKIYHEGQLIPAVLLTEKLGSVLIIGSSEGVVSQMSLDCGATKVVHVDIDRQCVEKCAELLPYGYSTSELQKYIENKAPVEIRYEDGFKVVKEYLEAGTKFDVIVMDLPDENLEEPESQQNRLYEADFLQEIKQLLTPTGAFITQAGCPSYWRNQSLKESIIRFNHIFEQTVYFEMTEQDWSWLVGINRPINSPVEYMTEKLINLPYRPDFIDEQTLIAATIIPFGLRKQLQSSK